MNLNRSEIKNIIKSQMHVRWWRMALISFLLITLSMTAVPLTLYLDDLNAQTNTITIPTTSAAAAMNVTGTTTLTTTALSMFNVSNTGVNSLVVGNHNIYGWTALNTTNGACFIQVFDRQTTGLTVGTTPPIYSIPIPTTVGSTSLTPQAFVSPMPLFHMTSTLTLAATTAPTNNVSCGNSLFAGLIYK